MLISSVGDAAAPDIFAFREALLNIVDMPRAY